MDEYRKPYLRLFNAVTDALREMERGQEKNARDRLIRAQIEAEDCFVSESGQDDDRG